MRSRDGAAFVTVLVLASCGGKVATGGGSPPSFGADTVLATGNHLAILGIEGNAIYAVDWTLPPPMMADSPTTVRGLRIASSPGGKITELGTATMGFFHSAALWRSGVLVLGAAPTDAFPKYFFLGDGAMPLLQSHGAIGMVSNLATADGAAYFAEPITDGVTIHREAEDGSASSLSLPSFGTFVPGLSVTGTQVCVGSESSLRCTSSPSMDLVRGTGVADGNFTPIVVQGDHVFEFSDSNLIRVSTTDATAQPLVVATFPEPPAFDPFYQVNLPGETQLVPDGEWIYFAAKEQGLLRIAVSGGVVDAIVHGPSVNSVAVDSDAIFFTTIGPGDASALHGMQKP
jgi:hypothetical protein